MKHHSHHHYEQNITSKEEADSAAQSFTTALLVAKSIANHRDGGGVTSSCNRRTRSLAHSRMSSFRVVRRPPTLSAPSSSFPSLLSSSCPAVLLKNEHRRHTDKITSCSRHNTQNTITPVNTPAAADAATGTINNTSMKKKKSRRRSNSSNNRRTTSRRHSSRSLGASSHTSCGRHTQNAITANTPSFDDAETGNSNDASANKKMSRRCSSSSNDRPTISRRHSSRSLGASSHSCKNHKLRSTSSKRSNPRSQRLLMTPIDESVVVSMMEKNEKKKTESSSRRKLTMVVKKKKNNSNIVNCITIGSSKEEEKKTKEKQRSSSLGQRRRRRRRVVGETKDSDNSNLDVEPSQNSEPQRSLSMKQQRHTQSSRSLNNKQRRRTQKHNVDTSCDGTSTTKDSFSSPSCGATNSCSEQLLSDNSRCDGGIDAVDESYHRDLYKNGFDLKLNKFSDMVSPLTIETRKPKLSASSCRNLRELRSSSCRYLL